MATQLLKDVIETNIDDTLYFLVTTVADVYKLPKDIIPTTDYVNDTFATKTSVDTELNKKANLSGGNTFIGPQIFNNAVTLNSNLSTGSINSHGNITLSDFSHITLGLQGYITGLSMRDNPNNSDAVNKGYIDSKCLKVSGGNSISGDQEIYGHVIITGGAHIENGIDAGLGHITNLYMRNNPDQYDAVNKKYIDDTLATTLATKANLTGGNTFYGQQEMYGPLIVYGGINAGTQPITNLYMLDNPDQYDAVNKHYVDAITPHIYTITKSVESPGDISVSGPGSIMSNSNALLIVTAMSSEVTDTYVASQSSNVTVFRCASHVDTALNEGLWSDIYCLFNASGNVTIQFGCDQ